MNYAEYLKKKAEKFAKEFMEFLSLDLTEEEWDETEKNKPNF